ncbi:MAG TPA: GAF domain-containing sensor histidine kinase [Candidatus Dormibacteraeota bacterium]|nr:GAF domain-containing sensor histidine kinase [Candidatus Dormibacteraeota bacterium]
MNQGRDARDVLLEAGLTLASELSLPIVLQRIVDLAAQVTDARYGALGVIGEDGLLTEFVTTGISARQRKEIGALPRGKGLLGYVISHPKPIRVRSIADHAVSVGFPPHHPKMSSFLGAPVVALGKVFGNIYLTEKRGAREFSAEDEVALVVLATQAGVAVANASLYEETRQRERWLDALRRITSEILAGADADSLLGRIAENARELAGADMATIVSTTANPKQLVVAAASGGPAARIAGESVPADRSISGEVMRTGKPLVFANVGAERRAFPPLVRAANLGPAIFVPLRVRGGVTGTLMVGNLKGGRSFSERSVVLVETFADQASVAMEYGRAQVDQRRLELMDERERIAKELHDGIIQSLFAVGMGLQGTAMIAGSRDVAARVERAVGELDRVIRDLRNYIFGLRPGILADRQLDEALRALGEEVATRSRVRVDVAVDAETAAALSAQSHEVVQLTREALSNVTRHAGARRASVELARRNSNALLTIEDDGAGFDTKRHSHGNGLRNMSLRATDLGGELQVTSAPGKGTKLAFTIPLDRGSAVRPGRRVPDGRRRERAVVRR